MWLYKGHKNVVMGYINFENQTLTKRWRENNKNPKG
jgi:hypothetical protein